ncbi:MAG: HopJ type III effector protein [Litorilituus sp.]|jgi:hypothetical protein|nr:HopJ type III effector protein [Litorilituus sp.]
MALTINCLLEILNTAPETVEFEQVMQVIADNYQYNPSAFVNGEVQNQAGTNEGSCKIFTFAKLHQLSEQTTLHCFGRYYREDVLQNPQGNDHGNIRNFINHGWLGIKFTITALTI